MWPVATTKTSCLKQKRSLFWLKGNDQEFFPFNAACGHNKNVLFETKTFSLLAWK